MRIRNQSFLIRGIILNMEKSDFQVDVGDGLVHINTLSPTGKYYYRIKMPVALNPSAFGCRISFFTLSGKLIYHRKGVFAHEIHMAKEILEEQKSMERDIPPHSRKNISLEFVKWSKQGNMVYFLEYAANNSLKLFQSVLLILNENVCYRIDETIDRFQIVGHLGVEENGFDEEFVMDKLKKLNVKQSPVIKNRIVPNGILGFFSGRWFPETE